MKKIIKWFVILGIFCCLMGTGIITAGAMMGGDKQIAEWFGSNEFVRSTHHTAFTGDSANVFQKITEIEIDAGLGLIEICSEERSNPQDTSIRVESLCERDGYDIPYSIAQEQNELKIKMNRTAYLNSGHHENHGYYREHGYYQKPEDSAYCTLVIYVPRNYTFEDVDIDIASGELAAEELNTQKLDLKLASGAMDLKNVQANKVEMDCAKGSIRLELQGRKTDYNYEIECAAGEVILGGAAEDRFSTLHSEKKIGNGAGKFVEIDCEAGNVYLDYTAD